MPENIRVHTRGYLPHYETIEAPQHIVFRLNDSLPTSLLDQWESELHLLGDDIRLEERGRRIEEALDMGIGSCHLKRSDIAQIVQDAILHFDGKRYKLHAWVIMPNHVHVLASMLPNEDMSRVVHSWKSYTATTINRLLGLTGTFWQKEYYDRLIRSDADFAMVVNYIHGNPVAAGLCQRAEDWTFGSARRA